MTIQADIEGRLADAFSLSFIEVVNESFMHNVPPGSESHFKVTLASPDFAKTRKVKRHQMVYAAVGDDMPLIHALSIAAKAPSEA